MVFCLPLPLSTILMLLIDVGTDMYPAISFAYESAELDIMQRMPRNSKRDRLVLVKLLSYSYGQIGQMENLAGFWTYFNIMNDYGFTPGACFNLGIDPGVIPKITDIY